MSDVGLKATAPTEFLGDGLFVSYDGYQYRLYASNGISVTNEVFLEPSVLQNFLHYISRIRGAKGSL